MRPVNETLLGVGAVSGLDKHQGVPQSWTVLGRGQAERRVRAKALLWMNHRGQPGGLLVGGRLAVWLGQGPPVVGSRPGTERRAGNGEGQGVWLQRRPREEGSGHMGLGLRCPPRALDGFPPSPASIC